MENNNKVTIHDIARALNIDSSTVSRALNDSPRVAQKTKDKIIKKSKELGYLRNHLASNLRKSKTYTLGVIVPRISRHFFSSAISGIEETAYSAGYNVIICQSLEVLEREQKIAETLLANRVDGVLISISMETNNDAHLRTFLQRNIPIVFFDRDCNSIEASKVLIDDFDAGFNATEHLILNGCKQIVHFSGTQRLNIYKNRFQGYKAALEKYGIPYRENFVFTSRLMQEDGLEIAQKIASLPVKVDGIFSANDVAAIGAMKYFKTQGIKVPEDIAIIGFSNEPTSSVIEPPLSTILQSGFEIGKISTQLLLSKLNNKKAREMNETIILKTSLIERKSSKR